MKVEIELKLQSYCTHFLWYHHIISDSTLGWVLVQLCGADTPWLDLRLLLFPNWSLLCNSFLLLLNISLA